ncbi:cobyric acid synthase [Candidatus Hecatella orcuttiae]|jgi:adenosylcobyric acid synthase|uniref:cobyric acid synthase n=1 Tax=Candidatus Hecatella orcuttiae TaxID=1935119 RepID=UPI0028680356|nr:cobyric acid synthase [Candidatus Hecatella orcuttiae]
MKAKTLMVQGTSSHCGKTLLVAAFCRIFSDAGYRVAPFKAQNMSLNSFVTEDGAEIARAQALQAFAGEVKPSADMNPILLKPKGDMTSQIVFHGKPYRDMGVEEYYRDFALTKGWEGVQASFNRLASEYDLVLIEGAGSPAEINLYEVDIANMRTAEAVGAPVLLVADIDRGGVFANLVGTMELLKPRHRKLVRGFIINKFRGHLSLLEKGLKQLEALTGKPVLGVLPYIPGLLLPGEDSVSLEETRPSASPVLDIAVIRLPRISNFTDFDPLQLEPGVQVRYVECAEALGKPDAIILPGTKNTVQDLLWLRSSGLAAEIIRRALEDHTPILGICGGYQMLGKRVVDEKGIEGGSSTCVEGLGLLDVVTEFGAYAKTTRQVSAQVVGDGPLLGAVKGESFSGYEIHMGTTHLGKDVQPAFRITRLGKKPARRLEGVTDRRGLVIGTYIHGLFDAPPIRKAFLTYLSSRKGAVFNRFRGSVWKAWQRDLEKLAQTVKNHVDMDKVCEIVGLPPLGG